MSPRLSLHFFLIALCIGVSSVTNAVQYISPADTVLLNRHLEEAQSLYGAGAYKESISQYRRAQSLADETGAYDAGLRSRIGMSSAFIQLGELDSAFSEINTAIEAAESDLSPDHPLLASLYTNLGIVYRNKNDPDNALVYYRKAHWIYRANNELLGAAAGRLMNNIGVVHYYMGDLDSAIAYSRKAADIRRVTLGPTHYMTGESYRNIGIYFNQRGRLDSAIVYLEKTLEIYRDYFGEEHPRVGEIYSSLGAYRNNTGDHAAALDLQFRALSIYKSSLETDDDRLATVYNHMGIIYSDLKDYTSAGQAYNNAFEIRGANSSGRPEYLGNLYLNMGVNYTDIGEYDRAIHFLQEASGIYGRVFSPEHPTFAYIYNNLGFAYSKKGEYDLAEELYLKGVNHLRLSGNNETRLLVRIYNNLGDLSQLRNDPNGALPFYQRAIITGTPSFTDTSIFAIPRQIHTNAADRLLTALRKKALVLRSISDSHPEKIHYLNTALETYTAAVDLIRSVQTGLRRDESRLLIASESHLVFEEGIETALALYDATGDRIYLSDAFALSEANKSSVLLQSFADLDARTFAGIPDSLLGLESDLRHDIVYHETEMVKSPTEDDRFAYHADLYYTKKAQYDLLLSTFEKEYPEYYEIRYRLMQPDLDRIRNELDARTAILHYFAGSDELLVFVVTAESLQVFRGGDMREISANIRRLSASLRKADRGSFIEPSAFLYRNLITPVKSMLGKIERLIVIPDGELFYLPFEALIADLPKASFHTSGFAETKYLIEEYEVSYHYAARLYRNSTTRQKDAERYASSFVGFAPVFEDEAAAVHDAEVGITAHAMRADDQYRSILTETGNYAPLPFSRLELENIIGLFQQRGLPAVGYLFDSASEENFKLHAAATQIVHVASHGIIHDTEPRLSGIVFARPEDEGSGEDGLLFAAEMFNLNLDADLVVLSSCESGAGEVIRGEGLIALTRGILFAGARNVVVSLWKVYDRHTGELMVEFYRNILSGQSYPAALRSAKLSLLQNDLTAFPAFWSGFILIGG